ncbi:hypothetical protein H0H81_009513 [Sphagnurus paluster]|uniref:Protein kinase domain-containing protein n=1 Tax=Sphagnurus paluster TaxID=117069 RepID=A0A9P7GIE9_9AGAR|nr:hypothetical protein H0H81_009513 [Sphagnurus paluster]
MTAQKTSSFLLEKDDVRFTSKLEVDRRRKFNQYVRQERIGKGQHGEVFLCKDEGAAREVALKIVKRNNPRDRIKLLRRNHQQNARQRETPALSSTEHSIRKEIAVMKKCRHANIARLFEVIDDPEQDKIYLVHHQGIIHRDIKPANLLWTKDRTVVKIIDFGVSHYTPGVVQHCKFSNKPQDPYEDTLFQESDLLKRTGTPSFLAPEIVWFSDSVSKQSPTASSDTLGSVTIEDGSSILPHRRPPITKAIDVWSLAVTFYCLLFGHTPFNVPESANENVYHNEFILYKQICTQDWQVDETMGSERICTGGRYPKDSKTEGSMVISLLDRMLQKDPSDRATISDLKQDPWILRGILEPKEWISITSPSTSHESATFFSRWKQASQKILNFSPKTRRIP